MPPFIPPSLKKLCMGGDDDSYLDVLPGMLEASGARLERLDVSIVRPGSDPESYG
jgi:hypothetical protein